MHYETARDEIAAELAAEIPDLDMTKGIRVPAIPTREEIRQLLAAASTPPGKHRSKKHRDYTIMRLFYASGIRLAELVALYPCDVRWDEQSLFIRSGKGDKDRYVLIDHETVLVLQEWVGDAPVDAPLFDVEERSVQRIVEKYGKETGIYQKYLAMGRSFSPHSFRHAFATHCYENGMDLFTLKRLLGHQYLDTTEIYVATGMKMWAKVYNLTHEFNVKKPGAAAK